MDEIKREINLRTRESTVSREFYWPRVFSSLAIVALIALLLLGSVALYIYQFELNNRISSLEGEKQELEARAARFHELVAEIRLLSVRYELKKELVESATTWSIYLRDAQRLASNNRIALDLVHGYDDWIYLRGKSLHAHRGARYMLDLEALDTLENVYYELILFDERATLYDDYMVEIYANIVRGDENGDAEESDSEQ